MATIYPRKLADGQVVYCVNFVAPDGRRRRKIIGPDLQLAREYLNQLRVELQKARMGQPLQPLSIPEAALRFLEEIKADRSPGTFVKYRFILRTFLDYLSERWPRVQNLGDITPRVLVPIFEKRIAGKGPDGFVFPEEQATRGSRHNNLRREFKRLVRSLGLEDATLHDFKRSFVTHLFESGKIGDPRIIQVLAHHESLDTTLRYARQPSTDQMRGAVDNLPV